MLLDYKYLDEHNYDDCSFASERTLRKILTVKGHLKLTRQAKLSSPLILIFISTYYSVLPRESTRSKNIYVLKISNVCQSHVIVCCVANKCVK